jgi:uncharacterized protein YbgA (DUF1722 family)/uncharacterized protein YbbK (DUF523 family)
MEKIRIGISSCLLGKQVRYNGGHQRDRFITDTMSTYCEFVPVCPEVECGLPIPRESMRLVGNLDSPRLITTKSKIDHTEGMQGWIARRLDELAGDDLVAFIFKTKSPSSGLRSVKVYLENGNVKSYKGQGMFARAFTRRFPDIPVDDEGRLHDPGIRENFIETIFVLQRWREGPRGGGPGKIVEFHSRHKYTLMAHSPEKLRQMGKIVARIGSGDIETLRGEYFSLLLQALSIKKTVKKNYNVLLHVGAYFKKDLEAEERAELKELADRYYRSYVPLVVPLTFIQHYARKYEKAYLEDQWYLNPHPVELGLLNHV